MARKERSTKVAALPKPQKAKAIEEISKWQQPFIPNKGVCQTHVLNRGKGHVSSTACFNFEKQTLSSFRKGASSNSRHVLLQMPVSSSPRLEQVAEAVPEVHELRPRQNPRPSLPPVDPHQVAKPVGVQNTMQQVALHLQHRSPPQIAAALGTLG
jgi:hypothetical protein